MTKKAHLVSKSVVSIGSSLFTHPDDKTEPPLSCLVQQWDWSIKIRVQQQIIYRSAAPVLFCFQSTVGFLESCNQVHCHSDCDRFWRIDPWNTVFVNSLSFKETPPWKVPNVSFHRSKLWGNALNLILIMISGSYQAWWERSRFGWSWVLPGCDGATQRWWDLHFGETAAESTSALTFSPASTMQPQGLNWKMSCLASRQNSSCL